MWTYLYTCIAWGWFYQYERPGQQDNMDQCQHGIQSYLYLCLGLLSNEARDVTFKHQAMERLESRHSVSLCDEVLM